jgi:hypothetical protein
MSSILLRKCEHNGDYVCRTNREVGERNSNHFNNSGASDKGVQQSLPCCAWLARGATPLIVAVHIQLPVSCCIRRELDATVCAIGMSHVLTRE